jgi:hypothetical protein
MIKKQVENLNYPFALIKNQPYFRRFICLYTGPNRIDIEALASSNKLSNGITIYIRSIPLVNFDIMNNMFRLPAEIKV